MLARRLPATVLTVAALCAGVSACNPAAGDGSSASSSVAPTDAATATDPTSTLATAAPTSAGPTASATATRATTSSGDVILSGVVLPNRTRTSGAGNTAVTQTTIHRTICLTGYTSTIRPPSSYTTALKIQQLDSGYAFHADEATTDYEEDHLIPLELGGSPRSTQNLWPEPYAGSDGAKRKDLVENKLHDLVCSGRLSLRTAQAAIARNWWQAYLTYGGLALPHVFYGAFGVVTKPTATATATSSALDPRFGTCKEAIAAGYGPYYQGRDPEYYWYRDADGDGVDCER